MIAEVAAHVPASLAAYRDGVSAGPGRADALPLAALRDPDVFDATLAAFGDGSGQRGGQGGGQGDGQRGAVADRRILVSYWSQFYLAALATPALTALMRLGRPLPLAFDTTRLELDAAGRPCRFLIASDAPGDGRPCDPAPGLAGLVDAHLRPFVALCHARCGLAPRILWGNAAVILDYVARELGDACGGAGPGCDDVATGLGWRGDPACARSPLSQALCPGASGCRRRRACCLRHRLPGIPSCGALCPRECAAPR